jgi:hypothetical protein
VAEAAGSAHNSAQGPAREGPAQRFGRTAASAKIECWQPWRSPWEQRGGEFGALGVTPRPFTNVVSSTELPVRYLRCWIF